jgi:hypothetical protein
MKEKIYKVKCGAIVREVPKGALQWYIDAKWTILEEETPKKKVTKDDSKTDTKDTITE